MDAAYGTTSSTVNTFAATALGRIGGG